MPRIPTPQDVFKAATAQTEALLALPGLLISLTNQVKSLADSLAAVQRMAIRAEKLLDEVEPGIKRVAKALDDPIIDEIPATLREIQSSVLPTLKSFRDTQAKITAIADSTTRLAGLPGAALFGLRRPVVVEPEALD